MSTYGRSLTRGQPDPRRLVGDGVLQGGLIPPQSASNIAYIRLARPARPSSPRDRDLASWAARRLQGLPGTTRREAPSRDRWPGDPRGPHPGFRGSSVGRWCGRPATQAGSGPLTRAPPLVGSRLSESEASGERAAAVHVRLVF